MASHPRLDLLPDLVLEATLLLLPPLDVLRVGSTCRGLCVSARSFRPLQKILSLRRDLVTAVDGQKSVRRLAPGDSEAAAMLRDLSQLALALHAAYIVEVVVGKSKDPPSHLVNDKDDESWITHFLHSALSQIPPSPLALDRFQDLRDVSLDCPGKVSSWCYTVLLAAIGSLRAALFDPHERATIVRSDVRVESINGTQFDARATFAVKDVLVRVQLWHYCLCDYDIMQGIRPWYCLCQHRQSYFKLLVNHPSMRGTRAYCFKKLHEMMQLGGDAESTVAKLIAIGVDIVSESPQLVTSWKPHDDLFVGVRGLSLDPGEFGRRLVRGDNLDQSYYLDQDPSSLKVDDEVPREDGWAVVLLRVGIDLM